ncbi:unnamed protein product [Ostreobium quekettii]|nr:unnamed protein product [Ostreobium quekettii]
MDEEESIVMRLQDLESELNDAQDCENNEEEIGKLAKAFIDFHGEIVMLLHWGHVNYVAVTKILKKHDKQTGLPLHTPCIETVLQQPFFSTELLQRLAKRVGSIVDNLISDGSPTGDSGSSEEDNDKEEAAPPIDKPRGIQQTHMALGMWRELRVNASTPSTLVHVAGDHLPEALLAQEEPAASTGPRVAIVEHGKDSDGSESCKVSPERRKRARAADEEPGNGTRRRRVC